MGKSLYVAYFTGVAGQSLGLFYIGDGLLVGIDVATMQYSGSYTTEADGTMRGVVEYVLPAGTALITGAPSGAVPARISVNLTLPPNFADGQVLTIETPLGPVNARFEKIKDIPQ